MSNFTLNPIYRTDHERLFPAVPKNQDPNLAASRDVACSCEDIRDRRGPAIVECGQYISWLETGDGSRRVCENLNDWYTGSVEVADRFTQPQAPETPRRQHSAPGRLGTHETIGEILKEISYLEVDGLECHLTRLVVDRCLVPREESEPHNTVDRLAQNVT